MRIGAVIPVTDSARGAPQDDKVATRPDAPPGTTARPVRLAVANGPTGAYPHPAG